MDDTLAQRVASCPIMRLEKTALEQLTARCKDELGAVLEEAIKKAASTYQWTWRLHDILEALFRGDHVFDQNGNEWRWHSGKLQMSFDGEPWRREPAWASLGYAIERQKRFTVTDKSVAAELEQRNPRPADDDEPDGSDDAAMRDH